MWFPRPGLVVFPPIHAVMDPDIIFLVERRLTPAGNIRLYYVLAEVIHGDDMYATRTAHLINPFPS